MIGGGTIHAISRRSHSLSFVAATRAVESESKYTAVVSPPQSQSLNVQGKEVTGITPLVATPHVPLEGSVMVMARRLPETRCSNHSESQAG